MEVVQFMASTGFGGAEKAFVELSNALAGHCGVTALILRGADYRHRFASWVPVIELRNHPTRHNPFLWLELRRLLRQQDADIVHTHAGKAAELVDLINPDRRFVHLATKHNDRKSSVFNRLPFVSAVSEKGRLSVRPRQDSKVWVIYNGIDTEDVEYGRVQQEFTILAVGRLDAIKGFDQLIKAVAGLDFPFRLRIAGEGPERSRLEKEIGALNLEGKVFLEGFRDDIHQMMADSHLVVISSCQEGGPRVLPEALFYAPMLIATPVGMAPEVLPPEFRCGLAELSRKITDVRLHYARYRRLFTRLAGEKKNDFHLSVITSNYLALYEEILQLASSRRKNPSIKKEPKS
jgi:glycosyltransferase involved in cell wall biosynthesis